MVARSISDLSGPRRLPLIGNAHQLRPDTLHLTAERWARLPPRGTTGGARAETRRRIAARPELREEPENFLESMIAAQETEGAFSDEEIIGNVFTLLLAGEDTTSHSMAWTIWALARRPAIQAKWAEEAPARGSSSCTATPARLHDEPEGAARAPARADARDRRVSYRFAACDSRSGRHWATTT